MNIYRIYSFYLILLLLTSCMGVYVCTEGSGVLDKQVREFRKFSGISLFVPANVFISQDSVTKVIVETDDNLFDFVLTDLKDDILVIESVKGICPKRLNLFISTPEIELLELNGTGGIFAQTPIQSNKLTIRIYGSGDVVVDSINANKVNIAIDGSGDIRLGGYCENFSTEINGSGDIKAMKLTADNAKIRTSGSGDVYINCSNSIDVSIAGSGDVYYLGEPKLLNFNISGSGELRRYKQK